MVIKQFNINKLGKFKQYNNIRIISGASASGKSTKMYAKALKYCSKGFTVYYYDSEGTIFSRIRDAYSKKLDNDLFSVDNVHSNFRLNNCSLTLEKLQQELISIALLADKKVIIMLDTPEVFCEGGMEGLSRDIKKLALFLNTLKLKTFMTMQTSRDGTLSIAKY